MLDLGVCIDLCFALLLFIYPLHLVLIDSVDKTSTVMWNQSMWPLDGSISNVIRIRQEPPWAVYVQLAEKVTKKGNCPLYQIGFLDLCNQGAHKPLNAVYSLAWPLKQGNTRARAFSPALRDPPVEISSRCNQHNLDNQGLEVHLKITHRCAGREFELQFKSFSIRTAVKRIARAITAT